MQKNVWLEPSADAAANRQRQGVCLLVLGMHRSGTSAVARVLSLLGAGLPEHVMGPGLGNERGHWEPEPLVYLHETMLAAVGSRWDDWRAIDLGRIGTEKRGALKRDIAQLLNEQFGAAPGLFLLKEPRICRFVPLYAELFAEEGIAARYVLPIRNPLAVIASLGKRDGMSQGYAGLLWLRHVLDAEAATREAPRAIISYETFLDDWKRSVRSIAARTGVRWPRAVENAAVEVEAFLSKELQHFAPSRLELAARRDIADWVKQAHAALVRLETNPDVEKAFAVLDTVKAEFEAAAPVFGHALYGELKVRDARFEAERVRLAADAASARATLGLREGDLGQLKTELAAVRATLGLREGDLGQLKTELAAVRATLGLREGDLGQLKTELAAVRATLGLREGDLGQLKTELAARDLEIDDLRAVMNARQTELMQIGEKLESYVAQAAQLESGVAAVQHDLAAVYDSTCWRLTAPLRAISRTIRLSGLVRRGGGSSLTITGPTEAGYNDITASKPRVAHLLDRYRQGVQRYGIFRSIPLSVRAIYRLSSARIEKTLHSRRYDEHLRELSTLIAAHQGFIDLLHIPMGWNTPLFQRFQHMSLQAPRLGGLALYGGHRHVDKDLFVFQRSHENVLVFDALDDRVVQCVYEALLRTRQRKILRLQSIDLATTPEHVKWFAANGFSLVYEYIDEISEDITGAIPDFVRVRHETLLRDECVLTVATSDALFNQVRAVRSGNCLLSTNGVAVDHWRIQPNAPPPDMKRALQSGRTVVAYHGALARWIDYELLRKIADNESYELVLIGHEHDASFAKSGLAQHPRVHFLGSKSYFVLNSYAAFYDVGIVPFRRCALTDAVSPVKLFEYMAAGAAVVTTDLMECRKYKSCMVAHSHDDFLEKLRIGAAARNEAAYRSLLADDVACNSWERKAAEIFQLAGAQISPTQLEGAPASTDGPMNTASYRKGDFGHLLRRAYRRLPLNAIGRKTVAGITRSLLRVGARPFGNRPKLQGHGHDVLSAYVTQVLAIPSKVSEEHVHIAKDSYVARPGDPKLIAYYLPQFHPTPENNLWWGEGTTEWTNVSRAVPQYVGHYQPRLPGELGHYDLRIVDNMKRQMELARMYGVHGFAFYYYWFDGRRLLHKPIEMMLENRELDIPFCLCWANESWTRRFDGTCGEVLIEQSASVESYAAFIDSALPFMRDSRYICVENRPVLIIYRPSLVPECAATLRGWRQRCRNVGVGDPYIIGVREHTWDEDLLAHGFDAQSEFHPGTLFRHCRDITKLLSYMRKDFGGIVLDYPDIVEMQKYFLYSHPKLYRAVMPMWDNTARRDNMGMIFHGSTPELYQRWLRDVCAETKLNRTIEEPFVFINAWNEWGEGAYLEPDRRHGYAYLQATRRAIEGLR